MGVNKRNSEGYYDPTAYEALSNIEREAKAARAFRPIVYKHNLLFWPTRANMCTTKRKTHFTEVHTMKKITTFENAIANRVKDIRAEGINATAFWAYRRSQDNGNDRIDFSEVIWDEDVAPIAETFKQEGIDEFTISSTFSSLIATLAAFEKNGYRMDGLTEVNANYTDWQTNERARIPAIRLVRI